MPEENEFKFHCDSCPTAEDCRHAFGKYYVDKSGGGVGCNCRFPGYRRNPPLQMFSKGDFKEARR